MIYTLKFNLLLVSKLGSQSLPLTNAAIKKCCHDTQRNDSQPNDIQRNEIQHNNK